MLIDSHCHVLDSEYENVDEIIKNAIKSGVQKMIINGYDYKSSVNAVFLSEKYDQVYAAIGVGPENITDVTEETFLNIEKLVNNSKVVAVGEIGLDYYWTKDNKDDQMYIFRRMLSIAKKYNLPVIVHNREATKDVYSILKESGVTGILHCFSGSVESANEFIKLGFLIGIGGVVTFKNAKHIKEVVESIPLTSISLETDSPYLSPEPYRGKTNEPSKIIYVAKKIAEIKNVDLSVVISETGQSIRSKFDL